MASGPRPLGPQVSCASLAVCSAPASWPSCSSFSIPDILLPTVGPCCPFAGRLFTEICKAHSLQATLNVSVSWSHPQSPYWKRSAPIPMHIFLSPFSDFYSLEHLARSNMPHSWFYILLIVFSPLECNCSSLFLCTLFKHLKLSCWRLGPRLPYRQQFAKARPPSPFSHALGASLTSYSSLNLACSLPVKLGWKLCQPSRSSLTVASSWKPPLTLTFHDFDWPSLYQKNKLNARQVRPSLWLLIEMKMNTHQSTHWYIFGRQFSKLKCAYPWLSNLLQGIYLTKKKTMKVYKGTCAKTLQYFCTVSRGWLNKILILQTIPCWWKNVSIC